MTAFSVRLDPPSIKALLASPSGPVARDLLQRGNRVLNRARALCPVDEGRLRASLTVELRTEDGVPVVRVGTTVPYAIFVHEGTGIYAGRGYIYPKSGRFLRWPVKNNSGVGRRRYAGGQTANFAYARRVRGVPPRPFLRQALEAAAG